MSAAVLAFAAAAPAPTLAFLEGIGAMEMMLVGIIGLLLFGGKGLPDMARTLGKVVREFKKASANVEEEVKRVMNEAPAPAPKPRLRPPVASLPPAAPHPISPAVAAPSPPSSASTPSPVEKPDDPPPPPA
jgi:TatA/E family protein of Tat protein translocase